MNQNLDSKLFAGLSSIVLVAALGVAVHGLAGGSATLRLNHADLNVDDSAGAAVLYHRIRVAADDVCGVGRDRDVTRQIHAQICARTAVNEAVVAANAPALTDLYQATAGGVANLASIR